MTIEYFDKRQWISGQAPKAIIHTSGLLSLNKAAIRIYDIKDMTPFVLLGFDKESREIILKFTQERQKGRKKICSGQISAKSFFEYFGIDYSVKRSYPLLKKRNKLIFKLRD